MLFLDDIAVNVLGRDEIVLHCKIQVGDKDAAEVDRHFGIGRRPGGGSVGFRVVFPVARIGDNEERPQDPQCDVSGRVTCHGGKRYRSTWPTQQYQIAAEIICSAAFSISGCGIVHDDGAEHIGMELAHPDIETRRIELDVVIVCIRRVFDAHGSHGPMGILWPHQIGNGVSAFDFEFWIVLNKMNRLARRNHGQRAGAPKDRRT